MLFSIHKNIAYVFVFTLALTSTNSFGMQKGQYDNTVNYIPFSNRSYLWQPQQPTSMSAYLTHNIHSQFGNGESISSSSAIPVHVFNNCTFNFGQQNLNHSPKKKGRGPGKKTLAKQEELVTNTSFDLNEAGKSIDIARQSGKYELSALVLACSQEYIDLTKDELASSSDQESDSYSNSQESEEEALEIRGDTGYSLRNVKRVHWGTATHEIPEVKSAFISADENSECEDDKQITKKPKVIKENKLKVPQKKAKRSRSGRKIKTPNRLADMRMVGTVYK